MNFVEIYPGLFVGMHMVTRFEFAELLNPDDIKGARNCFLRMWFIGDSEVPGVDVRVKDQAEAFEKMGMKPISNLNLVKP